MSKDTCACEYYSDHVRYADIINGVFCEGASVVRKEDLRELDTRSGKKTRDLLRDITFGNNSVIIGIENQDYIDYSIQSMVWTKKWFE